MDEWMNDVNDDDDDDDYITACYCVVVHVLLCGNQMQQ